MEGKTLRASVRPMNSRENDALLRNTSTKHEHYASRTYARQCLVILTEATRAANVAAAAAGYGLT